VPDPIFADPRLAAIYDELEAPRLDLDHYEAIVAELAAATVIDIGCGTGELACRLARNGCTVTAVDPAEASLAVARRKPGAEGVRWVLGDAGAVPPVAADLAVMTGNVAQVFIDDHQWSAALAAVRAALRSRGHFVFETRDPEHRAWEQWNRDETFAVIATGSGPVEYWTDVTQVRLPFVSFRQSYRFAARGELLVSDSTLRFRSADEVAADLVANGFRVVEVRDAPDRPSRELVFVAETA
jgi:SAM-dependent methyltransferase